MAKKSNRTKVGRYVEKTRSIFERRARRARKLRQDTRRALIGVLEEIRDDVVESAKQTSIGHRITAIPDRTVDRLDRWLDRIGLARKAPKKPVTPEAPAAKPETPRRRTKSRSRSPKKAA